jgi:hypothetical protein
MREFSAIPTVRDAADRHARVRRRYTVDEDTTVYKSRAILRARAMSLVHTLPLSPNWLAFTASAAQS